MNVDQASDGDIRLLRTSGVNEIDQVPQHSDSVIEPSIDVYRRPGQETDMTLHEIVGSLAGSAAFGRRSTTYVEGARR